MRAGVLELEARAGDEVVDRARGKDLTRSRKRRHAGACVHRDAADIRPGQLELSGVEAEADLQAERPRGFADRDGAMPGGAGPVRRPLRAAVRV